MVQETDHPFVFFDVVPMGMVPMGLSNMSNLPSIYREHYRAFLFPTVVHRAHSSTKMCPAHYCHPLPGTKPYPNVPVHQLSGTFWRPSVPCHPQVRKKFIIRFFARSNNHYLANTIYY